MFTFSVEVAEPVAERLRQRAAHQGISTEDLIRQLLTAASSKQASPSSTKRRRRRSTIKPRLDPELLAYHRLHAGLTVNGLAKRAGVAQTHLAAVERGDNNAGPATIKKVADALGVQVADLLHEPANVAGADPSANPETR